MNEHQQPPHTPTPLPMMAHKPPGRLSVKDINARGHRCCEEKNYEEALANYSHAIHLRPDKHASFVYRARVLRLLDKFQEALRDAERAISLSPQSAEGYIVKAEILLLLEKTEEARDTYMSARRLDPENKLVERMLKQLDDKLISNQSTQLAKMSLSEDFECVLCLKILYEPVTTPCGHTFCRTCLFRALDHASACPLCRSPLHMTPDHPVTVILQRLIEKHFPEEYKQRMEEMQQEEAHHSETRLPLFPLPFVSFPGVQCPLHIFEPKYRLMIRRCMAGAKMFGLLNVRRDQSGSSWIPYDIGCVVKITSMNVLPDGRSFIMCTGTRRFRIVERWEQDGYLVGRIQWIDDEPPSEEDVYRLRSRSADLRSALNELLTREHPRVEGLQDMLAQAGDPPVDDVAYAYWLASWLPLSPVCKQDLLETTSALRRMEKLLVIIRNVLNLPAVPPVAGEPPAAAGSAE